MSQTGNCPQCAAANEYTTPACHACGARLPWAAALERASAPAGTATWVKPRSCCGMDLSDAMKFCPKCGKMAPRLKPAYALGRQPHVVAQADDEPYWLFNLLSFMFPIVGLGIYLVTSNTAPERAADAGRHAFAGLLVGLVLYALVAVMRA